MKQDRNVEFNSFAANLGVMLKNNKAKTVAFTTDDDSYDILKFVNDLAKIYSNTNKVAVATYNEVKAHVEGVDYIVVDAILDNKKDIATKFKDYDCVLVLCPNMVNSKSYLHIATYTKDIIFVAKKWHSKVSNINMMKELAVSSEMNVAGIVYEK